MEPAPSIEEELFEWPEIDEDTEYHRHYSRQWIVIGPGSRQKKRLKSMD